jgi:tetratricopeptide (TPR) repeat protein
VGSEVQWYDDEASLLHAAGDSRWTAPVAPDIAGYADWHVLGRGGQAVVYAATQLSTKRRVAVKILAGGPFAAGERWRRFEREIDLISSFQHPHIVRLYDRGLSAQGLPYYVMELIEGAGVDELLTGGGMREPRPGDTMRILSVRDTLQLLALIGEAINYAHQRGVIHRDIKPSNIRIDREGVPHVLDFGLGKCLAAVEGGSTQVALSRTGEFAGSLPWASPEQLEGQLDRIDIRTDVYALGVLLYQMLTGRWPYPEGGGLSALIAHIQHTEPRRPGVLRTGVDEDVETIVLKCLAKEPERRYQTAGELARDVRHYLAGEPLEARRESMSYVLRKRLRRYRAALVVATAFMLVVVAGLVTSLAFWSQAVAQRATAERQTAIARAVNTFLQETLAAPDPYAPRWLPEAAREAGVEDALEAASAKVAAAFADQPEVEAGVRATLGATYLHRGRTDKAAPHLERSLALRRTHLGEQHPDTLAAVELVAELRLAQGDTTAGERLTQRVWLGRRAACGHEHPDTLRALSDLGYARHLLGLDADAAATLRQALDLQQRHLGDQHLDTLSTMAKLAEALQSLGFSDEANEWARRAAEGTQRALGAAHPLTLGSADTLASVLAAHGQRDEAGALYQKVFAHSRQVLGEDHPDTLLALSRLAGLAYEQGAYAQAETLYRELLDRNQRVLGREHPSTCTAMYGLGLMYFVQGKHTEAADALREVLTIERRTRGGASALALSALKLLARTQEQSGESAAAESLYREAWEGYRRVRGELDPSTLTVRNSLAGVLCDLGQTVEAEAIYREVLTAQRATLGDSAPDTLTTFNDLALLLKNSGRLVEAEPLYREVLEINRRSSPGTERQAFFTAFNLACLLREDGRAAEAEPLFWQVNGQAARLLTPEDWRAARMQVEYGRCLVDLHRFDEAEPCLVAGHAALVAALHADDARVLKARGHLVDLYEAWGKPDQAAAWRARIPSTQP